MSENSARKTPPRVRQISLTFGGVAYDLEGGSSFNGWE